jgi:outer membrane protein, heavy metal efflux system
LSVHVPSDKIPADVRAWADIVSRLTLRTSKTNRLSYALFFAVVLVPRAVTAQVPAVLSLADALARAAEANPTVLAARMARAVDVAGINAAGQRPNPEISVENQRETPHWAFGGSLPLELSGKRGRRIDVAKATLAVTEAETARVMSEVRADVRRAYFEVVAASRLVDVARELEKVATSARDAARERFQTGAAPRLDVLQTQLALSEAQNESASALGALVAARTELNTLLAYPPAADPDLADNLASGTLPTVEAAVHQAIAGNTELQVLNRQLEEASARVALAKALRRPDPSLTAAVTYGAEPEFNLGWRFGGAIALPIFTTGRADVAVAEAAVAKATADRDARASQISGAVAAAVVRADAAHQAVLRYETDVLPASIQVESMAQESYTSGQTGLAALLQTLQSAREIRQRSVRAALDYQLALADLERAMGTALK